MIKFDEIVKYNNNIIMELEEGAKKINVNINLYTIEKTKLISIDIEKGLNNFSFCYCMERKVFTCLPYDNIVKELLKEDTQKELIYYIELFYNSIIYTSNIDKLASKELGMYVITFNNKKEIIAINFNKEEAKKDLLTLLYNKFINKASYIKNIQYQYNYTDRQKVTFVFDNSYRNTFYNIPTKLGGIDSTRL